MGNYVDLLKPKDAISTDVLATPANTDRVRLGTTDIGGRSSQYPAVTNSMLDLKHVTGKGIG